LKTIESSSDSGAATKEVAAPYPSEPLILERKVAFLLIYLSTCSRTSSTSALLIIPRKLSSLDFPHRAEAEPLFLAEESGGW
jgi:hypothetical protein